MIRKCTEKFKDNRSCMQKVYTNRFGKLFRTKRNPVKLRKTESSYLDHNLRYFFRYLLVNKYYCKLCVHFFYTLMAAKLLNFSRMD